MNVALLGTGDCWAQGVAEQLHATGHGLTVYNRSIKKTQALGKASRIAPTAAEAMSAADVVTPPAVRISQPSVRCCSIPRPVARLTGARSFKWARWTGRRLLLEKNVTRLGSRYLEAPVLGSIAEVKPTRCWSWLVRPRAL